MGGCCLREVWHLALLQHGERCSRYLDKKIRRDSFRVVLSAFYGFLLPAEINLMAVRGLISGAVLAGALLAAPECLPLTRFSSLCSEYLVFGVT